MELWKALRRRRLAMGGGAVIALLVAVGIGGPWIAPYDPLAQDLSKSLEGPSWEHWFGTDSFGRDILSRVLYGARISLLVGVASQGIAFSLGVALGVVSGYYGGKIDGVIMRLADVTLAFPTLLLLIAITAAFQPGLTVLFVAIGIVGWAGLARLVRSQTLVVRELDFIQAARALGMSDLRLLARHVLPNTLAPAIIAVTLGMAGAILLEAALSFIGLGAQPPTPSWGAMISDGRDFLRTAPWISIFPGLAIGFVVLGFNLFGDGLRDAMDPRLRGIGARQATPPPL
ncbi:MAG TPA: ABC transporter permease [Gemmatimonadota bacterium]|nr:ABC transporter permease [Gemmatimonadota bacterium]